MEKPKIIIREETITPAIAEKYLAMNYVGNRPLSRRTVKKLVRDMVAGRWRLDANTIKINGTSVLDGQHRLWAIKESGVTITTFVARNVPMEAFATLDTGKSRTPGDALGGHGWSSVNSVGAVARGLYFIERQRADYSEPLTHNDVIEVAERHRKAIDRVLSVLLNYKYLRGGKLMAATTWCCLCDREKGAFFLDGLAKGIGLEATDPVYVLRQKLINNPQVRDSRNHNNRAFFSLFFKAWNAYVKNEELTRLGPSEIVPWPAGGPYRV